MPKTSDLGQARLQGAIYVHSDDRRDNCGGCVYTDKSDHGSHFWCRAHSAPVTRNSVCSLHEQPKIKKWVAA